MNNQRLEAIAITHRFSGTTTPIFNNFNCTVAAGEKVALIGRSGSGKTTLLHILSGMMPAQSGQVLINRVDLKQLPDDSLAKLRNRSIGFVYQTFNILKDFTALENIAMVSRVAGLSHTEATAHALACLDDLGIGHLAHKIPRYLSGGEKQRVAIARAIVNKPDIIFADEPTGNLDYESAQIIMQAFEKLHQKHNMSLIMATHDQSLTKQFHRIIEVNPN